MKIALVQLSDIHIADSRNEVLGRAQQVRAAVRSCVEFPSIVALLYTGDLAFSGKQDQYRIADDFCSGLRSAFEVEGIETCEVFIPGNHDVDIGSSTDELRDIANAKVKEDVNTIAMGGTLTKRLLEQQNAFFEFAARRTTIELLGEQRLFHVERIEHEGVTIDFHLFNTAFTSTLNEQPGSLVFPDQVIPAETSSDADLAISLLHHPLHWLEPSNARRLKKFVESGCDLIFTGHEHLPDAFLKFRTKEHQNCYVEGSSLHDPPARSAFNVVEVDFDNKSFTTRICTWNGELYAPGSPRELPLVRNISTSGSKFRNTHEFARWLEDPGTLFTHNEKRDLNLSDFFVYPTMRKDSEERGKRAFVDSADCPKYLAESKHVLILGEEGSGKTSLAKSLYRHYLSETTDVPLLLSGEEFESVSEKEARALIKKAFRRQYGEHRLEQYTQAPPFSKALIIDDWQKIKFNARGQARIMQNLDRTFGKIVCLGSDLLTVEQVTASDKATQLFAGFDKCSLPEFGVRLRGRLIEKWHSIGQEYTISDENLAFLIKQSEIRINLLLEKNFLPSFPFVVLTLLQADDAPTGNANLGSYGHLYELLITRRLGESSDKLTDLGTKYTYISRLAYQVLSTDCPRVSMGEMQELHDRYCEEYGQILDLRKMLLELEQAQIISRDSDSIRFKYKACYCYFAAKYFQENLAHDEQGLRAKLREIADRVF